MSYLIDLSSKEIYILYILNAFRLTGFMKFTCIIIELTNLKVKNISTQNFGFLFSKSICHFVLCLVSLLQHGFLSSKSSSTASDFVICFFCFVFKGFNQMLQKLICDYQPKLWSKSAIHPVSSLYLNNNGIHKRSVTPVWRSCYKLTDFFKNSLTWQIV